MGSRAQYHVLRFQVKAGTGTIKMADVRPLLSFKNTRRAAEKYSAVLGVGSSQIRMYRILATPRKLTPGVLDLFTKDKAMPLRRGRQPMGTGALDMADTYLLHGDDFESFLFADARVLSARLRANRAANPERDSMESAAKKIEHECRDQLCCPYREVPFSCPAETERWMQVKQ